MRTTLKTFAILFLSALLFSPFAHASEKQEVPNLIEEWDKLWHEMLIDITIIGIIFAIVTIYLMFRYRRRRPDEEGGRFKLSTLGVMGWTLIPAFIFMADDIFLAAKNFEVWQKYRNVPENAYVVEVEAYMWGWDVNYPEENITISNELVVPQDRPVMVRLKSRDVVHSFFAPELRVKWDAVPGMTTYLWFNTHTRGEYVFTCTEYCGLLHSGMYGKIRVVSVDEFNSWLEDHREKGGNI